MDTIHFGRKIKEKPTNYINKESYLSAELNKEFNWNDEEIKYYKNKVSYNYDLNMKYFNSLDKLEFEKVLSKTIKKHKFKECKNLSDVDGIEGVYIMVLDQYKQVYIGQSNDIKSRIVNHWDKKMKLDRLICGDLINSRISINSFGSLDTTRIYYLKTYKRDNIEIKLVNSFKDKFILNRMAGGNMNNYVSNVNDLPVLCALSLLAKKRNHFDFVDINYLKELLKKEEFENMMFKYQRIVNL